MSLSNAIRQREEMISEYKSMLMVETNLERIDNIQKQIKLCEDQIAELKTGKPLFGKPKPLTQTTTLIEPNPEKPGEQIVTILNAPKEKEVALSTPNEKPVKRLGNKLRDARKNVVAQSAEDSLKAQIMAAKAAKKV